MMTDQDHQLPLLPLRDVVVYPHMVLPLFVGRERSIEALEHAMLDSKQVLLVAQRNASDDQPGVDDLYQVGTVSNSSATQTARWDDQGAGGGQLSRRCSGN